MNAARKEDRNAVMRETQYLARALALECSKYTHAVGDVDSGRLEATCTSLARVLTALAAYEAAERSES